MSKIGHNLPPVHTVEVFDAFKPKVSDFADAAGAWLDMKTIETEDQAQKLNDFITGCRQLFKKVEDARKADKEPHLAASKEVDRLYKTLTDPLQKAADKVKPMLTEYAVKKAAAEAEAQRAKREAAEAEAREAARLAAEAAARNDVVGEAEAEARFEKAREDAEAAAKAKPSGQIASATGGGRTAALRTYRYATITSRRQAFLALEAAHGAAFDELIVRLANADLRAGAQNIPGIEIHTEQRVA